MLKNAALGIVVIQKEGATVKSLENADIVCNNIIDALELLKNPLRIIATLRH
jgi:soluble P-type ATPase